MITLPDPPPGGYAIIVIAPPWPYPAKGDFPGMMENPAKKNHYEMMSMWDIKALPVWYIAGDDCPFSCGLLKNSCGRLFRWSRNGGSAIAVC